MRATRRRRRSQVGQTIPLLILCMLVLTGFAGMSVDLGHQFVQKRIGQTAVDAAAVAAATQWGQENSRIAVSQAPSNWNDQAIATAHDYVAADGFSTVWPTSAANACMRSNTTSQFTEEFFDSGYAGGCVANPSGFTNELIVNVPPLSYGGSTTPKSCNGAINPPGFPYNCVQVVVVQRVTNYLMQIVGFNSENLTTLATALANPTAQGTSLPPANAVQLTEPTSKQAPANACSSATIGRCFNENAAALQTTIGCTGASDNCPTLNNALGGGGGHTAIIAGADGSDVPPGTSHLAAVVSAGDIVNEGNQLTFCDPDGFTCALNKAGNATSLGYMLASDSSLYCQGMVTNPTTGNPANDTGSGLPAEACTSKGYSSPAFTQGGPGQYALQPIAGNPATYVTPAAWNPACDNVGANCTPSNSCGGLILNGDPITAANNPPVFFSWDGVQGHAPVATAPPAACVPNSREQFTIMPGQYQFIVINFGQYEFEGGFYDITGNAPVNTLALSGAVEPNGIDHSQEQSVGATNATPPNVNKDWDLCMPATNNTVTGCTETAGVWIGQGNGGWKFGAAVASTGTSCSGGTYVGGTVGGGGKNTNITGTAVSFRFESTSNGFVSTSEVSNIALGAPAVGALPSIGGDPILFDIEKPTGYVHLDSNGGHQGSGAFSGMIYQTANATGGGVEIDPGLGSSGSDATLTGQVIAYRLSLFGAGGGGPQGGYAIDFSEWWGTGTSGPAGAGNNESSLITVPNNALTAGDRSGHNTGTLETLYLQYNDEWMLDAYDVSVVVDNLTTYYFSTGLWTLHPPNSSSTPAKPWPPQNGYTPSDANPMFGTSGETSPAVTSYTGGTYTTGTAYYDGMTLPSPAYSFPSGPGSKPNEITYDTDPTKSDDTTFDISGDWSWGNQSNISLPGGTTVNHHQRSDTYSADIYYTFPIPAGQTLNVTFHSVDGDHCGDYDNTTMTFNNVTRTGGATSGNAVELVQ